MCLYLALSCLLVKVIPHVLDKDVGFIDKGRSFQYGPIGFLAKMKQGRVKMIADK
jgi:hypothetical protein